MCNLWRQFLVWLFVCFSSSGTFRAYVKAAPINVTVAQMHSQIKQLERAEENLSGRFKVQLSKEEKMVDLYLELLREQEVGRTSRLGYQPSEIYLDHVDGVRVSRLFRILTEMPKGGSLHLHERHTLPIQKLLDIVWKSEDFEHLYIQQPEASRFGKLAFYLWPPSEGSWTNVKKANLSVNTVIQHLTAPAVLSKKARDNPLDSRLRWKEIEPLFTRYSDVISNENIRFQFLEALCEDALSHGIQYIEARNGGLEKLYALDSRPEYKRSYGRRMIDSSGDTEANMTVDFIRKFKETHQQFFGLKIIYSVHRSIDRDTLKQKLSLANQLHKKYPDLIIGFDFVGFEDGGHPLSYFAPTIINLMKTGECPPLYLHAGETNIIEPASRFAKGQTRPDEKSDGNAVNTVLLGSKRVGHGLGYKNRPVLLEEIKRRNIAIEICPATNQLFGYTPDLRQHPGLLYHRSGIPVVISADAPGTFKYNSYALDWYLIHIAWKLDLTDIKILIQNSLEHSAMTQTERHLVVTKWKIMWSSFIQNLVTETCVNLYINHLKHHNVACYYKNPYVITLKYKVYMRDERNSCQTLDTKTALTLITLTLNTCYAD